MRTARELRVLAAFGSGPINTSMEKIADALEWAAGEDNEFGVIASGSGEVKL